MKNSLWKSHDGLYNITLLLQTSHIHLLFAFCRRVQKKSEGGFALSHHLRKEGEKRQGTDFFFGTGEKRGHADHFLCLACTFLPLYSTLHTFFHFAMLSSTRAT